MHTIKNKTKTLLNIIINNSFINNRIDSLSSNKTLIYLI